MTLDSVRDQTYLCIEHLLIDGGSTDESMDIIKNYPHLAKVISEPDLGTYDAMNKGILLATGDIIGILNADDFYKHADVIAQVMEVFKNKRVEAVYGDLNYVDPNNVNKIVRKWRSGRYDKNRFLKGWMPPHPAFFIKKKCYEEFGLYNTKFTISADYELMLRMLYLHQVPCAHIPEVLVAMRTGGQSNSSIARRLTANREDRQAWQMNGLKPGLFTLWLKPLSKLSQYI